MYQWRKNKQWIKGSLVVILGWTSLVYSADKEETHPNLTGFYLGGFGGWGVSNCKINQHGIAFYLDAQGGPLVVDSNGSSHGDSYGLGGLHVGYEWLNRNKRAWNFTPSIELEGFYFAKTKKTTLVNPTDRLDLHEFKTTIPMHTGIILANGLLAFANNYLTPYIGIGLGAGIASIHDADSTQTATPEPGLNHFNSNPNAFNWTFATQAKAGLRYSPIKHMRFFAEYRFLFLAATTYTFGHTLKTARYPNHPETADWNIRFSGMCNNLFVLGIDFPI